jgi:hypothetical protein
MDEVEVHEAVGFFDLPSVDLHNICVPSVKCIQMLLLNSSPRSKMLARGLRKRDLGALSRV